MTLTSTFAFPRSAFLGFDHIFVFKVTKVEKQTQRISRYQWHCLSNETDKELSIIEIQFGDDCRESDITRKQFPRGDYLFSD